MRTKNPLLSEKMLDTAAKLFGTQRFHEVKMDDVALAAQVSKGTLYRYFPNKEAMYLALLTRASKHLIERLKNAVDRAKTPPEKLVALVDSVFRYFDAQPHLFDIIVRAEGMLQPGKAFPWQPVRNEGIRLVQEILQQGIDQGFFHMTDLHTSALLLLGGMRAVVRFGKKPRRKGLARKIVNGFLNGVNKGSWISHPFSKNGFR